ncbi:MAG: IclR family transcriptional regulator C-terminal domain-containing protein [Pseudomonadota bacterium]
MPDSLSDDHIDIESEDAAGDREETGRAEFVGSFEKGLRVMRTLAEASRGMTQTEVAEATDMTRASARRFLLTLIDLGYAEQIGHRFELTPQVFALGGTKFDSGLTWELARPHLEKLSAGFNESVSAAIRDGEDIVYVARSAAKRLMTVNLAIGSRLPVISTSMGRVILSDISEGCFEDVLSKVEHIRHTPFTKVDPAELKEEMARIREQGYAAVDQELELGLRSLAVPIRNANGRVIAGLNVSAQVGRVEMRQMVEDFLPGLQSTAERISQLARSAL